MTAMWGDSKMSDLLRKCADEPNEIHHRTFLISVAETLDKMIDVVVIAQRVLPYLNDGHLPACESLAVLDGKPSPYPCDCGQEKRFAIIAAGRSALAVLDGRDDDERVGEEGR